MFSDSIQGADSALRVSTVSAGLVEPLREPAGVESAEALLNTAIRYVSIRRERDRLRRERHVCRDQDGEDLDVDRRELGHYVEGRGDRA